MKTLIVYGSKYGATEVCAKRIAKELKGEVEVVNLKEKNNINLKDYDKIVIGSSVYAGMLRKEVKSFYEVNKETLEQKKVAVFLSCMSEEQLATYLRQGFSETLVNQLVAKACCGGIVNFKKMNFMERFMMKIIMNKEAEKRGDKTKVDGKDNIETLSQGQIKAFAEAVNKA